MQTADSQGSTKEEMIGFESVFSTRVVLLRHASRVAEWRAFPGNLMARAA
jgi:hypothetical protein